MKDTKNSDFTVSPQRTHSIVIEGKKHTWEVTSLWRNAKCLEVFDFAVNDYDGLDVDCWYCGINIPTVRSIIEHAKRIELADLNYPIILSESGHIMDGKHRICKALLRGQSHIKCVQFDKNPAPDIIEDVLDL